jgi:hypothetical protein
MSDSSFIAHSFFSATGVGCSWNIFLLLLLQLISKIKNKSTLWVVEKAVFSPAGQKHPDARRAKSRVMRRTLPYVAMTKDERNKADGSFSTAC